jgi:hypothetical protein
MYLMIIGKKLKAKIIIFPEVMKRFQYAIIFLLIFSGALAQSSSSFENMKLPHLNIVFAILEESDENGISEARITRILDSLVTLSVTGAKRLSRSGKTTNPDTAKEINNKLLYSIGDRVHGGIVFWVDEKGQHGLVACEVDQSEGETWYDGKTFSLKDGIFTGKYNTEQILANKSVAFNAAQVCASFKGGGYNDWYLPSKYELKLLYTKKDLLGGFAKDYYWSSTEEDNDVAWLLSFYGGYNSNYIKYGSSLFRVRAIRAF